MRWMGPALGLALTFVAGAAWAASTKDFVYRCSLDQSGCAAKIRTVRQTLEHPPPGRRGSKLCLPSGMSEEGFVDEVTHWIDEQIPPLDNEDDVNSIAAALIALYSCGGVKGLEGQSE